MNTLAVIGLGYVGLPLVVAFGKQMKTIGFDIAVSKVESCQRGIDPSRELPDSELHAAVHAEYTADPARLAEADVIIVAITTSPKPEDTQDYLSRLAADHSNTSILVTGMALAQVSLKKTKNLFLFRDAANLRQVLKTI